MHKTKAFKEEQEKLIAEKIEAEVQKRIEKLSSKEASTEEAEEVIESVEAEEADIANNDAAGAEEELSLKEKFKQAFNKESVNIKY